MRQPHVPSSRKWPLPPSPQAFTSLGPWGDRQGDACLPKQSSDSLDDDSPLAKWTAGSLGIRAERWEGGPGRGLPGTKSTMGSRDGVPGCLPNTCGQTLEREVSLSRARQGAEASGNTIKNHPTHVDAKAALDFRGKGRK